MSETDKLKDLCNKPHKSLYDLLKIRHLATQQNLEPVVNEAQKQIDLYLSKRRQNGN